MKFIVLRFIFDVVVLYSPMDCSEEMKLHLPYTPANAEVVKLDKAEHGGCMIRYRTLEIKLPADWQGV